MTKIQQEIIKIFRSFCVELGTIKPNNYEEIWSIYEVDSRTRKKIRTAVLSEKKQHD